MSLKARLLDLPADGRMQLLGAAANEQLRNVILGEILSLKEQAANMTVPPDVDGAVQFLVDYRRVRAQRAQLEDLMGAFTEIVSGITQADMD